MDHRFLRYYETELRFIRELSAEFARHFPKVAGRLGLSEMACDDPHGERLLQGFAFAAGRVHMALDAEFSVLTQPLAEVLYRNFLAPTPSMAVVRFAMTAKGSALGEGFTVPRDTPLTARARSHDASAPQVEFRTAHPVQLLPISIESATYTSVLREFTDLRLPTVAPVKALLKLTLRCHNMSFERLGLQRLPLFIQGRDEQGMRLYEQLVSGASTIVMRWGPDVTQHVGRASAPRPVRPYGFEPEQALLPPVAAAFEPYRLLQEYFACPARFDFVELTELGEALARCKSERVELLIPLDRFDETLEHAVDASRFVLFATPVVNLFPRQCGSFTVASGQELRVSADPTRPLDYEVHSIARVAANGGNREGRLEVLQPMYAMLSDESGGALPRYVVRRRASPLPPRRSTGGRASYIGNDVFLGLVEPGTLRPAAGDYKLEIEALCTNRDLPLALGHGHGQGALGSAEFTTRAGVPADAVHCIVAPSAPTTPPTQGETLWRLLSHLAPNSRYLHDHNGGADALRELLELYASLGAPQHRRQVEGILGISSKPIIGPLPVPGPRSFARGIEVRLECEEQAFGRHGAFTLAAVLARLFAKHTSANSFAQTVLTTRERGEVHRFPAQLGLRPLV